MDGAKTAGLLPRVGADALELGGSCRGQRGSENSTLDITARVCVRVCVRAAKYICRTDVCLFGCRFGGVRVWEG